MPLRVVIDDQVGEALKKEAEPLVDSVNSVLRRVLGLPKTPQSPMFFEIEHIADSGLAIVSHADADDLKVLPTPRRQQRTPGTRRRGKSDQPRRRAPKGSLLDERAYWKPILDVLSTSPDGSAPAREVVDRVGEMISDRLTTLDREQVSSGGLRWQTRVMFARLRMKDAGLLQKDSPRGMWQISDQGRQALADGRVEDAA